MIYSIGLVAFILIIIAGQLFNYAYLNKFICGLAGSELRIALNGKSTVRAQYVANDSICWYVNNIESLHPTIKIYVRPTKLFGYRAVWWMPKFDQQMLIDLTAEYFVLMKIGHKIRA